MIMDMPSIETNLAEPILDGDNQGHSICGPTLKTIVVQLGARHRYAVPRLLHQAGCLEALYTDSNRMRGMGRALQVIPDSLLPAGARRLTQREIAGVPESKVRSTDVLMIAESYSKALGRSVLDTDGLRDRIFSRSLARWGYGDATWIYSMFGEGWNFIEDAKRRGIRVVLDIFINPITHRIVEAERQKYPAWEKPENSDFKKLEADVNERFELADLLLCPADAVTDGIRFYPASTENKIRVVPYGFAGDVERNGATPVRRRVLFGGAATLRKGIHYFASATERLARSSTEFEFRVAGPVTENVRTMRECKHLEFLGPLTRSDFMREMAAADVFVLPTLAEGSATVIFEALALGIPVVTTRNAGSVIKHGREGLIVADRDAESLADAIDQIINKRTLRDSMSAEAVSTAAEFTEAQWGARLLAAMQSVQ